MPATGWGARSLPLEINVDTVQPPAFFGLANNPTDGLAPDSDTGVWWQPESKDDNYTADTTPTFWGVAEANTIIRLYVDVNANGVVDRGTDFYVGQTVTIPLDGNDQYPNGQWELTLGLGHERQGPACGPGGQRPVAGGREGRSPSYPGCRGGLGGQPSTP